MNDLIVETTGLCKRFGRRRPFLAVDGVSMTVRRGEVYGFLGPNGAGKTTTLKMLVGLMRPTAGSAIVAGHRPGDPAGLARLGCLIESPAFYPYLSGRENLRVVADYVRAPRARVDVVLNEVDLLTRADRSFGTYSTGMKQRLGVAAALLKDPQLLILDEPTNGLDPQGMAEMRKLIRELGSGERTVLLSSHLLAEVEQVCDRVAVISKGRLVAESTVKQLRGEEFVLVHAEPHARARELLTQMFGPSLVTSTDGALRIENGGTDSATINERLVAAGIRVSGLRSQERSLEDVFFQLTGEEQGS